MKRMHNLRSWIRRRFLHHSPVTWANFGRISLITAKVISIKTRPCVVISLPRSGSSWVGSVLSLAGNSAYLREPLTQSYMAKYGSRSRSFFEIDEHNLPPVYKDAADFSFQGLPGFPSNIVINPSQWSLQKRANSHVIIKEVNPFLIQWLIKDYRPKIIYLLRHPAAVANSFYKKGWLGEQFRSRLLEKTLNTYSLDIRQQGNFWSDFGALQALVLYLSLEALRGYKEHTVTLYEDLCINPFQEYMRLLSFCGLDCDQSLEDKILSFSNPNSLLPEGPENTIRNSLEMMNKWREEIPIEAQNQVKESYLSYNPSYYGTQEW